MRVVDPLLYEDGAKTDALLRGLARKVCADGECLTLRVADLGNYRKRVMVNLYVADDIWKLPHLAHEDDGYGENEDRRAEIEMAQEQNRFFP